jgi:DNA-binding transcriptional LysR family regulator
MDLRRLTHFIALAEEGRFAPAAARVHLSQAAFSRSIQALEERAGMALIDRGPHGITLTQAGEVVLRRARELVFDSSCLQRDLDLMKSGDAGELVIGAGPVPAATLVPELLIRLRKQSPLVVNRLRFGKLPQLLSNWTLSKSMSAWVIRARCYEMSTTPCSQSANCTAACIAVPVTRCCVEAL